jgi:hypothetical protein
MDGVDGAHWIYGATGVATKLSWKSEGEITYTHVRDVMTVCTHVTGAAIPAATVMTGGTSGTGQACTGVVPYSWMDGSTRRHRQCRWCKATFTSPNVLLHLAAYDPPATPKRTISGIAIWGAASA